MSVKLNGLYYQILENPANLKGTGLFTDERLEQIASWVADDQFEPAKLASGKVIPEWYSHKITGQIFNDYAMTGGKSYRNKQVLDILLDGEEIRKFNEYANESYSKANDARRFEKAEKISKESYTGWVYCEGAGYNEGYFESIQDFEDWLENDNDEGLDVEYVWACNEHPCLNINASDIIGGGTQEAYEDFDSSDLEGVEEFKNAVEKFMKLNEGLVSYTPDYSKVILLK